MQWFPWMLVNYCWKAMIVIGGYACWKKKKYQLEKDGMMFNLHTPNGKMEKIGKYILRPILAYVEEVDKKEPNCKFYACEVKQCIHILNKNIY